MHRLLRFYVHNLQLPPPHLPPPVREMTKAQLLEEEDPWCAALKHATAPESYLTPTDRQGNPCKAPKDPPRPSSISKTAVGTVGSSLRVNGQGISILVAKSTYYG
jgi:hypothetical protein